MFVEFMFAGRNTTDFKKLVRGAQQFGVSIPQLMMESVGAVRAEAALRQRNQDRAHICALPDWVD